MTNTSSSHAIVSLIARILLAAIFIMAGIQKFTDIAGTIGYMQTSAFPIPMLERTVYAVAALELIGGVMILLGLCSRWAAMILALFTLAAAASFHSNFADQIQMALFMKNLAIAGGLLLLFANGPGRYSVSGC